MLSFSKLGKHGNLGNQLFEIASTIGIAEKHNLPYVFPKWQFANCFKNPIQQTDSLEFDIQINEPNYHFEDYTIDTGRRVDLLGWFQSEKYWKHCDRKVKETFEWNEDFLDTFKIFYKEYFDKPVIAISVRRGDYVGNPNYHQLEMNYYLGAYKLLKYVQGLGSAGIDHHVFIFSDDIEYCQKNFPPEFKFIKHLGAAEQLALGSLCDHFIIANSSFSWWMAYLGEKKKSIVIAPEFWNAGELLKHSDDRDVVPERWIKFNPELKANPLKRDLTDVTFTIPVKYDHRDRKENLELCIRWLRAHFNTNIIIGEMDTAPRFEYLKAEDIQYCFFPLKKTFERTFMLNSMARMSKTSIVVNWDCDIFMKPEQLPEAANRIRSGEASGVYPYDGRFFRCKRELFYDKLRRTLSTDIFKGAAFPESQYRVLSYGGAIMWNKNDFISGGMENQYMMHYGPEDFERYERFKKLGFIIQRINGPLFHLDHDTAKNGSNGHEYFKANEAEFKKIKTMSEEQLRDYVSSWPWANPPKKKNKSVTRSPLMALNIERIVCLNLERRPERKEYAKNVFNQLGLEGVKFFNAIDGKEKGFIHFNKRITPGMLGCYESHKQILSQAIANDVESILVFEDDILPVPGINDFLNLAIPAIPDDWEFAYLGCTEYGGTMSFKNQVNDFWVVPKCAWGTQAYMIRGKHAIKKIYDLINKPIERQIDEELANHTLPNSGLKYYSIFPSAFSQDFEGFDSDVQKRPKKLKV